MSARPFLLLLILTSASACHFGPRLNPVAAGCYRLDSDSLPPVYRANLVPELPEVVRVDTANGGEVHVPRRWLESQGIQLRHAALGFHRPGWRLQQGQVVIDRRSGFLPSDSLVLAFSGGGVTLQALIAPDASDSWRGLGLMWPNPSATMEPTIEVRLTRGGQCSEMAMPQ